MKRTVSLGELLGLSVIVFGAILAFYVNTNVRLSSLEMQFNSSEKVSEKLELKLDQLQVGQNEIKIILQNKQDRK